MATTPANLLQTAVNAAVTLTSAFVQAGFISSIEEAKTEFASTRDDIYAVLKDAPNDSPAPTTRTTGGGTRSTSSAGGGKTFTADEAKALDLRFGKFKNGPTLGEIANFTAEECAAAPYGYVGPNGEPRKGIDYIKYLANNQDPKASYIRRAAQAVLDDRRAQSA